MIEHVFVYGSLRPRQANFRLALRSGLTEVRPARAHGLLLYHLEPEGYPAAVPGGGSVVGEVLSLRGGLDLLDRLEGLDEAQAPYRRERWTVELGGGSGAVADRASAWIYLYNHLERRGPTARPIPSGDWLCR